MVRALALFGAHAAGVPAIETVYPALKDEAGLAAYAARGRRDGFSGMMAIHPAQVPSSMPPSRPRRPSGIGPARGRRLCRPSRRRDPAAGWPDGRRAASESGAKAAGLGPGLTGPGKSCILIRCSGSPMRRALLPGCPAAADGGRAGCRLAAGRARSRAAPPHLRADAAPTPRPILRKTGSRAVTTAPCPPPPPLRADAPTPTPRPDPRSYGPLKVVAGRRHGQLSTCRYLDPLKGYRPLTLDLYQPQPRNYPLPLVVFVHDGGFGGGNSRHAAVFDDLPATLAGLAAQGYVVASVNYRLSGEARFPPRCRTSRPPSASCAAMPAT